MLDEEYLNRRKKFTAGVIFLLLLVVGTWAQETKDAPERQLYFLAGTPNYDYSYPVTLYGVNGGKLEIVRVVVPEDDGAQHVLVSEGLAFVLYPAQVAKAVRILHIDDPRRPLTGG